MFCSLLGNKKILRKLKFYEKVDFKKYFWHSVLVSIFLLSSSWMIQINLVKICKTLWRFSFLCLIHGTQNQTKIYLESRLELQLWCVSRFPIHTTNLNPIQNFTYYYNQVRHNGFCQYCPTLIKSRIPIYLEKL